MFHRLLNIKVGSGKYRSIITIGLFMCFLNPFGFAQNEETISGVTSTIDIRVASKPLTLTEAVATALEYNRQLRAAFHENVASGYATWESWSRYFPNLNFQSLYNKSDSEFYDVDRSVNLPPELDFDFGSFGFTGDIYTNQFQLQQLIFDYSVIGNIRLAKLQEEATDWQFKGQQQRVAYQTVVGYLQILRAQELLAVQQQRLDLAQQQLQTAQVNFDVGMRIRTDVLRAELARSSAARDVVSAEIAVERAQAELNRIMGIDLRARHNLQGALLETYDPPARIVEELGNFQDLFQRSSQHNPSIQVASILVRQSEEQIGITRGEFYPQLGLSGSWGFRDRNGPHFDREEWALNLSMNVPIFEGGRRIAKMSRTEEQLRAEQMRYEDTVRTIHNNVEITALSLMEEQRNLEIAQEAVVVGRENYERFLNLYTEGLADTLDVTQALTELVEAQTNVVTTRYGYLVLYAQILQDMGMIPVIPQIYEGFGWLSALE